MHPFPTFKSVTPIEPMRPDASLQMQELRAIIIQLEELLPRVDALGQAMAGNHISHGLELLRDAAEHKDRPAIPLR